MLPYTWSRRHAGSRVSHVWARSKVLAQPTYARDNTPGLRSLPGCPRETAAYLQVLSDCEFRFATSRSVSNHKVSHVTSYLCVEARASYCPTPPLMATRIRVMGSGVRRSCGAEVP